MNFGDMVSPLLVRVINSCGTTKNYYRSIATGSLQFMFLEEQENIFRANSLLPSIFTIKAETDVSISQLSLRSSLSMSSSVSLTLSLSLSLTDPTNTHEHLSFIKVFFSILRAVYVTGNIRYRIRKNSYVKQNSNCN